MIAILALIIVISYFRAGGSLRQCCVFLAIVSRSTDGPCVCCGAVTARSCFLAVGRAGGRSLCAPVAPVVSRSGRVVALIAMGAACSLAGIRGISGLCTGGISYYLSACGLEIVSQSGDSGLCGDDLAAVLTLFTGSKSCGRAGSGCTCDGFLIRMLASALIIAVVAFFVRTGKAVSLSGGIICSVVIIASRALIIIIPCFRTVSSFRQSSVLNVIVSLSTNGHGLRSLAAFVRARS